MKIFKSIFTIGIIILFTNEIYSQVSFQGFNYSLTYISTGNVRHTTTNPLNVVSNQLSNSSGSDSRIIDRYDTVYSRVCIIDFHDPSFMLSKIHVKIGTLKDSSDVYNYSFLYNDSLNVPEGTEYYTYDNKIYLGLFETIMTDMYYYKVWLESETGELSEPKYYF